METRSDATRAQEVSLGRISMTNTGRTSRGRRSYLGIQRQINGPAYNVPRRPGYRVHVYTHVARRDSMSPSDMGAQEEEAEVDEHERRLAQRP